MKKPLSEKRILALTNHASEIKTERLNNLTFLKNLDLVNRAIQGTNDLEQMMRDVLDATLSIFDCDRVWLVYPADPSTSFYQVPMERTKPEYPGALLQGKEISVDPETILVLKALKASNEPVTFDRDSKPPLPSFLEKEFKIQSQIAVDIYPKIGKVYAFGLHQCSYKRVWTVEEKRLLHEIGRRLADGLTSLLLYRELQKSENTYRNVIETASEGIWILNEEQKTTFVNQRLLKIMGYEEKEMLGKKLGDFVFLEEFTDHEKRMKERKAGKTDSYERRFLRKDGKVIWTHISATPLFDEKKHVVGAFEMLMDITKHKQAEKELIQVNRTLFMLSDINQSLIKITNEQELLEKVCQIIVEKGGYRLMWIGFAEKDQAKTVRPVAQAGFGVDYLKFTKITWADDEQGRGPTSLSIRTGKTQVVHDILKDPNMTPWRQAATERGHKASIALPLSSEGHTFGALNIYSSEEDAFGEKEMTVLEELAGDLAFGIATMRLRKKTEERTREVDQLKNNFIQIVSHQLRTPLTVVRWNLSVILERQRGEVVPAQEEALRGALDANAEIIARVGDLLSAIDVEEGRVRLQKETVSIADLFESICEEKLRPCHLKKITYEIFPPKETLPEIQMDAIKIRDVIVRLIDNAITYTNNGGHIVVKLFEKANKIRFEISDTGVGIPITEQKHLFERFHRGWNAALMKPDASGLSLFISKHFINIHKGTIGFTSVEKKGSTFWFELPIV